MCEMAKIDRICKNDKCSYPCITQKHGHAVGNCVRLLRISFPFKIRRNVFLLCHKKKNKKRCASGRGHAAFFNFFRKIRWGESFADELFEIKVAVEVGFYIDFVPRHSCEMDAKEALCVQFLFAVFTVYDVYIAGALGCDFVEFRDVGCRDEFDFVKIFAVADHNMHSFQIPGTGEMSISRGCHCKTRFPRSDLPCRRGLAISDACVFSFFLRHLYYTPNSRKVNRFFSILPNDRTIRHGTLRIVQLVYFVCCKLCALHNYNCRDSDFAPFSLAYSLFFSRKTTGRAIILSVDCGKTAPRAVRKRGTL